MSKGNHIWRGIMAACWVEGCNAFYFAPPLSAFRLMVAVDSICAKLALHFQGWWPSNAIGNQENLFHLSYTASLQFMPWPDLDLPSATHRQVNTASVDKSLLVFLRKDICKIFGWTVPIGQQNQQMSRIYKVQQTSAKKPEKKEKGKTRQDVSIFRFAKYFLHFVLHLEPICHFSHTQ